MAEIIEIKKETEAGEGKAPKAKRVTKKAPKAEALNNAQADSFAIIETGGKQYRVSIGDTVKVEKILNKTETGTIDNIKEGDAITFDKVLLIDNGTDSTDIGTPYIAGAKVSGTLTEIGRNAKVIVIKYKQKSRYFKKNGHRQPFFKVKIENIG